MYHYFLFCPVSIFNHLILLKCFSLFVTRIKYIGKAFDAIIKSKSSIDTLDICTFAFNSLEVSKIALSMSMIGYNSLIL